MMKKMPSLSLLRVNLEDLFEELCNLSNSKKDWDKIKKKKISVTLLMNYK